MTTATKTSAQLHDELGHPVIDVDAHLVEYGPVFEEYLVEFVGPKGVDRYRAERPWFVSDDATRQARHLAKPPWGYPIRARDHLTSMLPSLLVERLGELGIDFLVCYPSPKRLGVPHGPDEELRQPICRALNAYMADLLRPHAAHLTPAAVIPMHTPNEAIEELEYAVETLGMKATMVASYAQRARTDGEHGHWWDTFGLDSEYDYDPVWSTFQRLSIAPGFHSGTIGLGSRVSPTNSIYNFIGHFPIAQESVAKALVLGGVTRRFPELKFSFLTAGVAWAVGLFADLVDQFSFRNVAALRAHDPANFDEGAARELFDRYAPERLAGHADRFSASVTGRMTWPDEAGFAAHGDEYALAGVERPEDLLDRLVENFYFACEGGDRFTRLAFDDALLPLDAELKVLFGSDLGHYHPTPMGDLLTEAYGLVDDGRLTSGQFEAMTFTNPVELFAGMNPDFFVGTAIEKEASSVAARS